MAMEIKEGFKKTEAGVIPSDWVPSTVGDLIRFEGGSQPPHSTFSSFQYKHYIRLIQIRDYKTDKYMTFIPEKLARKKCTIDEIMIGRYGPTIFQILSGLEGAYNVALIKAIPNENLLFRYYAFHFLKQKELFHFIEKLSQRSGGQTRIDIIELKKYPFPLPPTKTEQTAIATALNNADALITHLEKLIAKKRNLKQGVMQELLKPKEGWEEKRIEEIFDVTAGGDYKKECSSEIRDDKHKYPIYSNSLVDEGLYGYCSYYTSDSNCITVTARGTIGHANYRDHKFTAIGRVIVLCPKEEIDCFYIHEYINNKINFVLEVTGVPQLTAPQISKYSISLPKTKEEQTRIAQILSDMDAEIESIQRKLKKLKMIKQGMMQNLLTGKIRLV